MRQRTSKLSAPTQQLKPISMTTPKWDSAQGYACALTAIMQSDTRPLTGGVTEEMVEAGWEAFNQHDDYRTAMREAYLAMKGEEK
jgi:hypothetical protein